MKYLIEDTEDYTLREINSYFKSELMKTSLNKDDIIIDDKLKVKLAMMELDRIFEENGMSELYELGLGEIHLNHTANCIEFSDNEIDCRFNIAYESILSDLI